MAHLVVFFTTRTIIPGFSRWKSDRIPRQYGRAAVRLTIWISGADLHDWKIVPSATNYCQPVKIDWTVMVDHCSLGVGNCVLSYMMRELRSPPYLSGISISRCGSCLTATNASWWCLTFWVKATRLKALRCVGMECTRLSGLFKRIAHLVRASGHMFHRGIHPFQSDRSMLHLWKYYIETMMSFYFICKSGYTCKIGCEGICRPEDMHVHVERQACGEDGNQTR